MTVFLNDYRVITSCYEFLKGIIVFYRLLQWGLPLIDSFRRHNMHHPVIGQPIDCLHQREFVNKTSICFNLLQKQWCNELL